MLKFYIALVACGCASSARRGKTWRDRSQHMQFSHALLPHSNVNLGACGRRLYLYWRWHSHECVSRPPKAQSDQHNSDGPDDSANAAIQGKTHEIEDGPAEKEEASEAGQDAGTQYGNAEQDTTYSKQEMPHEKEDKERRWTVSVSYHLRSNLSEPWNDEEVGER